MNAGSRLPAALVKLLAIFWRSELPQARRRRAPSPKDVSEVSGQQGAVPIALGFVTRFPAAILSSKLSSAAADTFLSGGGTGGDHAH